MSATNAGSKSSAHASGGCKTPTAEGNRCQLCRKGLSNKIVLPNCKHAFCKQCIQQYFKSNRICPTCGTKYDVTTGDYHVQFMMTQTQEERYIKLSFSYPWIQREDYVAYLPVTDKGKLVCQLLKVALERKIIFIERVYRYEVSTEVHKVLSGIITACDRYSIRDSVLPSEGCLDRVIEYLGRNGATEVDI